MNAVAPDLALAASTPEPAQPTREAGAPRRCKCGTDRTSRAATPEREYSLAGAAYLLWGGTSVPRCVRFRCARCQVVFDECRDRATLRAYVT